MRNRATKAANNIERNVLECRFDRETRVFVRIGGCRIRAKKKRKEKIYRASKHLVRMVRILCTSLQNRTNHSPQKQKPT